MPRLGRVIGEFTKPRNPPPRRRWLRRVVKVGALSLAASGVALLWFLYFAPLPPALQQDLPPLTAIYRDLKGNLLAELASADARSHRPVSVAEMGPWIPRVTISLEDHRFHAHPGVDARASLRALVRRHGGGSTITQQLIKIATRRTGRSVWAKAKEALLALQLERRWTKAQILEAYLNRIPYGNRLIGVEAAAQAYFGKPAAQLSQAEAIYLAGLPREPSRLNPWTRAGKAAQQFDRSRQLLARHGDLRSDEPGHIVLPAVQRILPENAAPHFVQSVAKPTQRGDITCTIDLDLQRRAQQLIRDHLEAFRRPDISQAAMVVIENKTGAVRALVGSRDFHRSQINGALKFRNSGSTLKPFLYLTGIEQRVFTAATLLPDTPDAARDAYGDYDPHNFILHHLGPVRVREALGNSLNVPAVVAVNRLGARNAFEAIENCGLRFDQPLEKVGAGFILGNVGVRLIDLTAAFSALARGGLACPPRFLEADAMPLRRIASPEAVEIITDILCDDSARLHSFGSRSILALPVRIAVKTGTSASFRDAWTVGFTREHTVGVWVGNFDGSSMDQAVSTAAAGPVWRRMIEDLLQTDQPVPAPRQTPIPICALTGLQPCPASPRVVGELFLPGTEPQVRAAGWFAPDGHPLLPKEYASWCVSADNHLRAAIRPSDDDLAILAPREGAVFVLDDSLPRSQQHLEPQVNRRQGVAWSINGEPLPVRPDGRVLWPLREGTWTLEARDDTTRLVRNFVVRHE